MFIQPFTSEMLREARDEFLKKEAAERNKFIDDSVLTVYNNIISQLVRYPSECAKSGSLLSNKYDDKETLSLIEKRIKELFPEFDVSCQNAIFSVKCK